MEPLDWRTLFTIDGVSTSLNDPALLLERGWRRLIYAEPPETGSGEVLSCAWVESADGLTQVWTVTQSETAPDIYEQLSALEQSNEMLLACVLEMSETVYA